MPVANPTFVLRALPDASEVLPDTCSGTNSEGIYTDLATAEEIEFIANKCAADATCGAFTWDQWGRSFLMSSTYAAVDPTSALVTMSDLPPTQYQSGYLTFVKYVVP